MNIEHLTLGIENLVRAYETMAIIDLLKGTDKRNEEQLKKDLQKKQDALYKIIVAELFFSILDIESISEYEDLTQYDFRYINIDKILTNSGFYLQGQFRTFEQAREIINSLSYDYTDVLVQGGMRTQDGERITTATRNELQSLVRDIVVSGNDIAQTGLYEVEWHLGARPTHQVWQGGIYDYAGLVRICGLGEVDGLLGVNCYHFYVPFNGVRRWNITEEMKMEQDRLREHNGVEYTYYQATQKQRQFENRIRKQKQKIQVYKVIGKDTLPIEARYRKTMQEYIDFSNGVKVPMQKERLE